MHKKTATLLYATPLVSPFFWRLDLNWLTGHNLKILADTGLVPDFLEIAWVLLCWKKPSPQSLGFRVGG